jgi:hypothetical protein
MTMTLADTKATQRPVASAITQPVVDAALAHAAALRRGQLVATPWLRSAGDATLDQLAAELAAPSCDHTVVAAVIAAKLGVEPTPEGCARIKRDYGPLVDHIRQIAATPAPLTERDRELSRDLTARVLSQLHSEACALFGAPSKSTADVVVDRPTADSLNELISGYTTNAWTERQRPVTPAS